MKILVVKNADEGTKLAKNLLYKKCDKKTALFLCGGRTPKILFGALAKEQKLEIGALAMVDDRYSFHQQFSNEFMIKESGLVDYVEKTSPFYGIVKYGVNREETARQYDETVRYLFKQFPKKVAVLGIGVDGHIAGLPAGNALQSKNYAESYDNFPIEPNERITLTFKALSEFDLFITLAFEAEKRWALSEMFKDGPIEEIPARFLVQKASKKTILITDQKI